MNKLNLTFGFALTALKAGYRVAREGWNVKGMYLWLLPAASVKAEWCKEPHLKGLAEANGGEIEALGSIRMLTADKKVLTGWLASQSDMLAEDWVVLTEDGFIEVQGNTVETTSRKHTGFVWDYDNGPGTTQHLFIRFEDGSLSLATLDDIQAAGIEVEDLTV